MRITYLTAVSLLCGAAAVLFAVSAGGLSWPAIFCAFAAGLTAERLVAVLDGEIAGIRSPEEETWWKGE